ncbi:MAG: cyclic nucleotide-binding domain-containing protein [Acidimicrobiia bacterium]|jgi:SulP family sulfate permease
MSRDPRGGTGNRQELRSDFLPGAVTSTLATGAVLGVVNALLTIALVSLIFRGDLADSLPLGIGLGLTSSAVIGLIIAALSSFSGVYAGVQDSSAAIIGLSAVSITGVLVGSAGLSTVVAMVAATSLATGVVLLAMGYLGWGEIARYVPFPVIGGLLAGTGYLILTGTLGILDIDSVSDLFSDNAVGLFWPALALATAFFIAARRGWSSRSYLVFLATAVGGFHILAGMSGVSRAAALDRGWLLGPFPEGGIWPGWVVTSFVEADWGVIAGELAGLVTVLIVVPITLLLYISALEIETRVDVDMNKELQATGWANLAAGVIGGPPGYMYMSDTVITSRLLGKRRGPALVAPALIILVVALGGATLELIPQFVIGGLLLFVGAEFAYEWLWVSRRRMSIPDYTLMWGILVVIATIGFLTGVLAGLIAATFLFVVRYSRIDVVKHEFTGADRRSNIERSLVETDYLRDNGSVMVGFQLQGFIFFGTASRILGRLRILLDEPDPPKMVILDFKRVTGVDSSAVAVFERVILFAREKALNFVFTDLAETQRSQFASLIATYADVVNVQSDLDHGIAWCEERILAGADLVASDGHEPLGDLADHLAAYLVDRKFAPGEVLMRQGDPSPGIYLIRSGRATVLLDGLDGKAKRLRTLLGGTVLGEISLYRDEPCTATVVTDEESEVLHLTPDRFADLCRADPRLAAELHAFVARALAGRVGHANRAIQVLRD